MIKAFPIRFAEALSARWKWLALSTVWLCLGTAACLHMWSTHGDPFVAAKLERTGLITEGPVVDIEKMPTHEWRVTYEFLNIPGQKFRGSIRVPTPEQVKPYEKIGSVTVRYLPTDPRVNAIVGQTLTTMTEETAQTLLLGTFFGFLPLLYAVAAAAFAARKT